MYLSVDIGGTNVRAVVADNLKDPKILDRATFKNTHNFDEYLKQLINFAKTKGKIDGIGISITGDLNPDKTIVIDSAINAPEILNQPIVKVLENEFNCKVFMENDGTASALGEAIYGSPEKDEFVYVIWGTGVGGALIKRENTQTLVEQIDWYKHFEEWEYVCGGKAIEKNNNKLAKDLTEDEWKVVMQKFEIHLLKLLENYKTENLVFGGGVALNQFERILKLKENLGNRLPNVFLTKLGDDTGLYGGFALIKQNL